MKNLAVITAILLTIGHLHADTGWAYSFGARSARAQQAPSFIDTLQASLKNLEKRDAIFQRQLEDQVAGLQASTTAFEESVAELAEKQSHWQGRKSHYERVQERHSDRLQKYTDLYEKYSAEAAAVNDKYEVIEVDGKRQVVESEDYLLAKEKRDAAQRLMGHSQAMLVQTQTEVVSASSELAGLKSEYQKFIEKAEQAQKKKTTEQYAVTDKLDRIYRKVYDIDKDEPIAPNESGEIGRIRKALESEMLKDGQLALNANFMLADMDQVLDSLNSQVERGYMKQAIFGVGNTAFTEKMLNTPIGEFVKGQIFLLKQEIAKQQADLAQQQADMHSCAVREEIVGACEVEEMVTSRGNSKEDKRAVRVVKSNRGNQEEAGEIGGPPKNDSPSGGEEK